MFAIILNRHDTGILAYIWFINCRLLWRVTMILKTQFPYYDCIMHSIVIAPFRCNNHLTPPSHLNTTRDKPVWNKISLTNWQSRAIKSYLTFNHTNYVSLYKHWILLTINHAWYCFYCDKHNYHCYNNIIMYNFKY